MGTARSPFFSFPNGLMRKKKAMRIPPFFFFFFLSWFGGPFFFFFSPLASDKGKSCFANVRVAGLACSPSFSSSPLRACCDRN